MTLTREDIGLEETDSLLFERRHNTRIARQCAVRLFESYAGKFFTGSSINVSVDGMCVRLPASINLRPGRFVTLHDSAGGMRLTHSEHQIRTARVVWVAPDSQNSQSVLVGLELYAAGVAAAA
jgi:hypothetical protein